jgi:hypothetical protein
MRRPKEPLKYYVVSVLLLPIAAVLNLLRGLEHLKWLWDNRQK